ncbi:putative reverse transcriptase [Senna tora]|uniref:Putative reverse transcriptase n=1 Tax=Senna tora TaxID=362788 RepID=A0A834VYN4_9FABA|nr:putative reverse transcriptase [Senna tora]
MEQENPKELSTEEQDNLWRSTKKSKPNVEEDGITLVLPSVEELEAMTEVSTRPMEESPLQPKSGDDTQMIDAENQERLSKGSHSKVVRSLTWGNNGGVNQSTRFEVLNQVPEGDNQQDSEKEQHSMAQPDNHASMDTMKISEDIPPRADPKKVAKNTNRKIESTTATKKNVASAKAAPGNKRIGKTSFEKANDHTVVTSSSSGKNREKVNSKTHIEGGALKQKKPPDYNEVLELMRIQEKMERDSGQSGQICTEIHNYKEAAVMDRKVNALQNSKNRSHMSWQPPQEGWYKINCDGSYWYNSDDISCGGVIRNSHGEWITGFSKKLGKGSVFQAELWGALLGLRTAWELQLPRVVLETDSKLVHNFITSSCNISIPFLHMAKEFTELLSKAWEVDVKHVDRDNNLVADSLAISAHYNSYGLLILDRVPDCCKVAFLKDLDKVLAAHRLAS